MTLPGKDVPLFTQPQPDAPAAGWYNTPASIPTNPQLPAGHGALPSFNWEGITPARALFILAARRLRASWNPFPILSFPVLLIILILWGLHFYYKLSQIIFYSRQSIKQQKWNITSLTWGWVSLKSSSPLCVETNVTAQTIPQSQNSEGPPDTSSGLLQTPTPDPPTLSMYQETSEAGLPIMTWIVPPGVVQSIGAV